MKAERLGWGVSLEMPVGDADLRGRLRLPLLERACGPKRDGNGQANSTQMGPVEGGAGWIGTAAVRGGKGGTDATIATAGLFWGAAHLCRWRP